MPENKPLPLVDWVLSEDMALSPAVAAIVAMTHVWTTGVMEFEADQTNLIHYYGLKLKGAIDGIFWKPVNPQELSKTVTAIQELRSRKAANDDALKITA